MEPYKVTALRMGLLEAVDYSQIVYLKNIGDIQEFPVWTALVQGNGRNILIDLGIYDPEWATANIIACTREELDDPAAALAKAAGIGPQDIDTVIFTHLHWDHIGDNLALFPNARFVVQEREWRYMHNPVSYQKWAYASSLSVCLDPGIDFFQWQFVNGWTELIPGVLLVPTPGHTPGHQGVLIKTAEGRLFVAGDAVNCVDNLYSNLPSGITSDGEAYVTSMGYVREFADFVIGAHDQAIEAFQSEGFPATQEDAGT
jgi:N-acyl homoserine lactone hydrolase